MYQLLRNNIRDCVLKLISYIDRIIVLGHHEPWSEQNVDPLEDPALVDEPVQVVVFREEGLPR